MSRTAQGVVGQTLQRHLPQPRPLAVASAASAVIKSRAGSRVDLAAPSLPPPAPDARTGELGGVVVDANADPALVAAQIIDSLGDGPTQPLVRKVLGTDLLRPATAMPLPAGIRKVPMFSFFLASTEMAGWSSSWKARTCRLMYSNWASRSASVSSASLVFRLACRLYPRVVEQGCDRLMAHRMTPARSVPRQPSVHSWRSSTEVIADPPRR